MFHIAYATGDPIGIEHRIGIVLRAHFIAEYAAGSTGINTKGFGIDDSLVDVVFFDVFGQCRTIDTATRGIKQTDFIELTENIENTTRTVALLYGIFLRVRRQLAQARYMTAQAVDVGHFEIDAPLVGYSQKMQYRIGGATHGNIEGHGIEKSRPCGNTTGQNAVITSFIVF